MTRVSLNTYYPRMSGHARKQAIAVPAWPHFAMAAFGLGSAFTVKFGGNLYVSELFALICLPFIGWKQTLHKYSSLRRITTGYVLVLVGLAIADYVNATPSVDWQRGWANPIFAITTTLFITSLLRQNLNAITTFLLTNFLAILIFGNASYALRDVQTDLSLNAVTNDTNVFKIRFVPFIIPGITFLSIILFKNFRSAYALLLLVLSIIFFALDARSSGVVLFISSLFIIVFYRNDKFTIKKLFRFSIPFIIFSQIAYIGYVNYSLTYNMNGHNAQQLALADNPYNPFDLISQGRSETLVAAYAIADRPIIGFGSWARDAGGYYNSYLYDIKGSRQEETIDGELIIPAHSVLLGLWIWGGALGFIGMFIVMIEALRNGSVAIFRSHKYQAASVLLFFGVIFDILFSPIGSIRLSFPQAFALLIILAEHYRLNQRNGRAGI